MKNFAIIAIAGAALFAGTAAAQGGNGQGQGNNPPTGLTPNAQVQEQYGGELDTATIGDDVCTFIGPYRKQLNNPNYPPSDNITVLCTNNNNANFTKTYVNIPTDPTAMVSDSFTASNHTISWIFMHPTNPTYTFQIFLDGVPVPGSTGVF